MQRPQDARSRVQRAGIGEAIDLNFDFTDDQRMLRDQARRFLDQRCAPAAVRAILESDEPFDRQLWAGIAELGWLGAAIPEEYGGIGLGYVELCVIAEELGRAIAPAPFSSSVYLANEAILLAGSEEQKRTYLPRLASGELIGTFALAEGSGPVTPASLSAAVADGRLTGEKLPVPDGDIADIAVVVANGPSGPALFLVDLTGSNVSREAVPTVDPTRSHARLRFDNAPCELLGGRGDGWAAVEAVQDRAAALMAFEQVGGAQASLDMAADYARERFAFGRQIGSFQAIKHKLADVYIATELARSNAYFGAWALNTGSSELPVAAAAARVAASAAYFQAARENIQTHGGMGFTWEYDCHLHYRRSRLLAQTLGGERRWKDRLVSRLEARNAA
jgi:acyl-CoA dehydrogenase